MDVKELDLIAEPAKGAGIAGYFRTTGIPLAVAINCHIEMLDEALESFVRGELVKFFEYLKVEFPSTPLVLFNPLCSSIHVLAAEVALDHDKTLQIIVPDNCNSAGGKSDSGLSVELEKKRSGLMANERIFVFNYKPRETGDNGDPMCDFLANRCHLMISIRDAANPHKNTDFANRIQLDGIEYEVDAEEDIYVPFEIGPIFQINVNSKNENPSEMLFPPNTLYDSEPSALSNSNAAERGAHQKFSGITS